MNFVKKNVPEYIPLQGLVTMGGTFSGVPVCNAVSLN
jgi:hypothetical protein